MPIATCLSCERPMFVGLSHRFAGQPASPVCCRMCRPDMYPMAASIAGSGESVTRRRTFLPPHVYDDAVKQGFINPSDDSIVRQERVPMFACFAPWFTLDPDGQAPLMTP